MPVPGKVSPTSPGLFLPIGRVIVQNRIKHFFHSESAVTAIEYALLAGLIAVIIVASITLVGSQVQALFNYVSSKVDQAIS